MKRPNESAPCVHQSDIVMLPYVLLNEIHNEHAHYSRLIIGFLLNNGEQRLPLMWYDSRFRLRPVWTMWSYMQLEKLGNFQNTARIHRQRSADASFQYSSYTKKHEFSINVK